jgi:4-carboxymuconolactone decarboxylase
MPEHSERYKTGMTVRRAVLGDEHVNSATKAMTTFDEDFQTFITEGAWGSLWSRPALTKRERSIVTLALLAALGHDDEFLLHIRATPNTGASMDDVKEAILHAAVYAGVPAGNHAFKLAKQVFAEMQEKDRSKKPLSENS